MKKALLALSAALLFALPASSTPQDPGNGPAPGPDSGPVMGRWDLPDLTGPGHFEGKLGVAHRDVELFRIVGRVERNPGSSNGRMKGRAILLVGPHAGREFDLAGRWDADGAGKGVWRAKILRPKRRGHERRPLLEMKGRYTDRNIVGPGGRFAGEWTDPT